MDKITQEDISLQTERELTSPLSSKRPRTDSTQTTSYSGKSRFDFPELVTFRKTIGSPLSTSILQKEPLCTAECGDIGDELKDTKLILTHVTKLTTPRSEDSHTGSCESCFIGIERHFLLQVKDEQPSLTESDKLSSYSVDDAGGPLAVSHTSKDDSTDTSSHPDCKQLGESLEVEPPGGCSSPAGNEEDGRQELNNVRQIQASIRSSSDEEVRCQSGCTFEDQLHDTDFCDTWSQFGGVEKSNPKQDVEGFGENLFFKEKEERNNPISSSDYAGIKSFNSNPEKGPSGMLAEGVKNEEEISELQSCENEDIAGSDGETKGRVNENGLSKSSIPSAAECAKGSIVSYDVVLARNIATETVSLEVDDSCWVKGKHAAGKMIAKAQSETADHTTETPMPATISQEPAEGDNDAGPFSVIDPTIWSETDREPEEKRCSSHSTAGVELSPSVKVWEMEMPLPLCSGVRPSQEVSAPEQTWQFNHQSKTQQCKDEKEDLCQSYTEPQALSEKHNKTGNEGSCLWESRPSGSPKPPPAGNGRQESHDNVGCQLKKQEQSGSFPVSLDPPKTQEVEYLQIEIARTDRATVMKEREEITFDVEMRTDDAGKSDNSLDLEKRLLENKSPSCVENKAHKEAISKITTGNCMNRTEGETIKYGNKSTHIVLSDHQYSAAMPMIKETTEEKGRKKEESIGEEADVQDNSEISVTSRDDIQQQSPQRGDVTDAPPDDCASEWTEGIMSNSGNKLTSVSQHEQGNGLICLSDLQHKAETFVVENNLLAFTFLATSDAVVPGPHELIPSQNADNNLTAPNGCDRFSLVPSAFPLCDRVPRGFDTFEKIQLSLDDDDDDDAGLSNSPLLTSLPGQLLKSPQRQLNNSMPEAESNKHEEAPEEEEEEEDGSEEEVERLQCHTVNMANGFLSSDYNCNELPNFISAADVTALGWPEQQPNSESTCNSTECFQDKLNSHSMSSTASSESNSPARDVNSRFEMKKQFDMVLMELNLYFDISMSDFASDNRASSPEQCSDVNEVLEDETPNCKEELSSPEEGRHRDASPDDADEDRSLDMCGGDPVVSGASGSGDGEQEVPVGSRLCQEVSMYTAETQREPHETEQKRKMWSPSFMCRPFLEQLNHRPPELSRRLEPMKTCNRPIRVGLSKRAKTKHLHRLHPYK